jgi:hypothetical protein
MLKICLLLELYFLRTNFALRFSPLYKYKTPVFISIFSRGSCIAIKSAATNFGVEHLPFLLFLGRREGFELALALLLACCLSCDSVILDCASKARCFDSDMSCCTDSWMPVISQVFWSLLQRSFSSLKIDSACEPNSMLWLCWTSCWTPLKYIFSLFLNSGLCRIFFFNCSCVSFFVSAASERFKEEQSEDDVELETIESVANFCLSELNWDTARKPLLAISTLSPTNSLRRPGALLWIHRFMSVSVSGKMPLTSRPESFMRRIEKMRGGKGMNKIVRRATSSDIASTTNVSIRCASGVWNFIQDLVLKDSPRQHRQRRPSVRDRRSRHHHHYCCRFD